MTRSVIQVVTLSLLLVVLGPPGASAAPDEEFSAGLREALANVKTPAGAKYDGVFGKSFAEKHQKTMVRCTTGLPAQDLASFEIVARVASDGKLERLLVEPRTKVAECLQKAMAGDAYPAPPQPHYWVHVSMRISR